MKTYAKIYTFVVACLILILSGCAKSGGDAPGSADATLLEATSCSAILSNNPSSTSGTYTIDPDGAAGPLTSFDVYCDMTTNGGGWTLVMKQRANDGLTLQGDTAYWTSSATSPLNDSAANLNTSDQNLVSAAFTKLSGTQLMLVAANEASARSQSISSGTAFSAFQSPTSYSDDVNSTRPNWFLNTSAYPNGNAITGARFGFNIRQVSAGTTYCGVRWGWTANQDSSGASVGTSDSCGGIGAYGTQYGSSYMNNSKNVWQPYLVMLYIK